MRFPPIAKQILVMVVQDAFDDQVFLLGPLIQSPPFFERHNIRGVRSNADGEVVKRCEEIGRLWRFPSSLDLHAVDKFALF